jgi:hypothetical protein
LGQVEAKLSKEDLMKFINILQVATVEGMHKNQPPDFEAALETYSLLARDVYFDKLIDVVRGFKPGPN